MMRPCTLVHRSAEAAAYPDFERKGPKAAFSSPTQYDWVRKPLRLKFHFCIQT
jgi:hypothetical protein